MKLITVHRDYKDFSVDFEVHHDGRVVVVDYDIDSDVALAALGDEMSPVLRDYLELRDNPFSFFKNFGVLGPLFSEDIVLPVFTASTAHMTDKDDDILKDRYKYLEVSGLPYDIVEYGYIFYLHPDDPPKGVVRAQKNKDDLSASIVEVLQRAYDVGIYRVNFDAEGPEIKGIATHEW